MSLIIHLLDLLHVLVLLHDLDEGWNGSISQRVISQLQVLQRFTGFYGGTHVFNTSIRQTCHFNTAIKDMQRCLQRNNESSNVAI